MPDPTGLFASADAFEEWLAANHAASAGLWLQLAKKGSGETSITYAEALDVALCFGWIDGQKRPLDERFWLQRFTPRRARSRWSVINRDHIARLTAVGRMRPAGQAEVDRAKADGRWEAAYEGQRTATVPEDLRRALDADPAAAAAFAALDAANRYAIIYRVNDAARPETRARRVTKYLEMLLRGERLHG